ncbi:MAG: hypothetical protein LBT40_11635 [Deltaproteobacteria bacterium]|jgi:hypothetical protein|nr:hypothetical protein [Deltaproteobacteria bacterium]
MPPETRKPYEAGRGRDASGICSKKVESRHDGYRWLWRLGKVNWVDRVKLYLAEHFEGEGGMIWQMDEMVILLDFRAFAVRI